jgi:hypothetical protein
MARSESSVLRADAIAPTYFSQKIAKNRQKIAKNRQKSPKIAKNRQKSPKIDKNRQKSTKIDKNRQKSPKIGIITLVSSPWNNLSVV